MEPAAEPPPGTPTVQALVLGPVDVRAGSASAPLGGAKVRAVLAQLVLAQRRVVPVTQLIDGMWGEDPPATAGNTLQYHVSVLRRSLAALGAEQALQTRPPGYALDLASDVEEFTRLRRAGDEQVERDEPDDAADTYAAALACWRGPALADLQEAPFAPTRAVALEGQRLATLEAWAGVELQRGRAEALVAELELLAAENPTRERLWEHLVVALYRSGRQADALAAYARARKLLDEELGVEPGPGLQAVHRQVLNQDPALVLARRPAAAPLALSVPTRLRSRLPAPAAWLVASDGRRHRLGDDAVVVGRHVDCDIVVAEDDVSRRHASIGPAADGHAVSDLGSTNGTSVNGMRLTSARLLHHGDRVEVGSLVLRYEAAEP